MHSYMLYLPLEFEEFPKFAFLFFFTQKDLMYVTVEMLTLTINNKVTTPKAMIHSFE